jgi:hypothetical protein
VPGQRTALMTEIYSLLAEDPGVTPLAHVEDVLTGGYAQALALEAEQLRLERHLRRLAGDPRADRVEAVELTERLSAVEVELSHLRTMLRTLRDRARELRAA